MLELARHAAGTRSSGASTARRSAAASASSAVCDIVVAAEDAVFAFSETKLGILPAVISPYVLAKIGASAARELFLTGARFDAARAQDIGLVHAVVPAASLDDAVDAVPARDPHRRRRARSPPQRS